MGAALRRLEELLDGDGEWSADTVARLRDQAESRQLGAWKRLGGGRSSHDGGETPSAVHRRLRLEMLLVERRELVRLRDAGKVSDDVLRRMQRDLDLEEAVLTSGPPD